MRRFLFVLACSLPISALHGGELPGESQKLLEQLADWEFKERTLLEQKVSEKREQIIESLQRHQETYTKRGDLETALTIRRQIEVLKKKESRPPVNLVYEMPWDDGEGRVRIEFHPEGIATYTNLKTGQIFDKGFRWKLENDRILQLWYHTRKEGEGFRFAFEEDFKKARVRSARNDFTSEAVLME